MAYPEREIEVGTLRWQVQICTRVQAPAPGGTGIVETLSVVAIVHADIQPIGALAFWGSTQVDTPVTHRIVIRWQDYLDNTLVIVRQATRPDAGSTRTETFRIRRVKEIGGRKRFVEIEAELERAP